MSFMIPDPALACTTITQQHAHIDMENFSSFRSVFSDGQDLIP